MKCLHVITLALACSALCGVGAHAQLEGGTAFVGKTKATPGCPIVNIHIIRQFEALSGVVFYDGGKGYSEVQGTTDGKTVDYHQTTIHGNGPAGVVHGTISPEGVMVLKVVGTSCSYETRIPMLHEYSNG